MSLSKFLFLARIQLDELNVQSVKEARLIGAANEGKNELVKIIRRAQMDFFESYALLTVPVADPYDPSEIDLPSDFASLKDLQIKSAGYTDTKFYPVDRSDPRFRELCTSNTRFDQNWNGYFLYHVASKSLPYIQVSALKLAPGSAVALDLKVVYQTIVYDMVAPDDAPLAIPPEHWDFIVTWMVVDALRTRNDPRYRVFLEKLEKQEEHVVTSVGVRQTRDPIYVVGYGEDLYG